MDKDEFVVSSKNGDLRFYNKIGGYCKNLLPSFLGDQILRIDSTINKKYLLLTFRNYLILLKTF